MASDSWERTRETEALAKLEEAKGTKFVAEADSLRAQVEALKATPRTPALKDLAPVLGGHLGVHMTWASAVVAVTYILTVWGWRG